MLTVLITDKNLKLLSKWLLKLKLLLQQTKLSINCSRKQEMLKKNKARIVKLKLLLLLLPPLLIPNRALSQSKLNLRFQMASRWVNLFLCLKKKIMSLKKLKQRKRLRLLKLLKKLRLLMFLKLLNLKLLLKLKLLCLRKLRMLHQLKLKLLFLRKLKQLLKKLSEICMLVLCINSAYCSSNSSKIHLTYFI